MRTQGSKRNEPTKIERRRGNGIGAQGKSESGKHKRNSTSCAAGRRKIRIGRSIGSGDEIEMKLTPTMRALNPHLAPRLSPEARKAAEKFSAKSEKEAQDQFQSFLTRHGYEFDRAPMHRKSSRPSGWPDFTLSSKRGLAIGLEFKQPAGIISPDQQSRHLKMIGAGWHVRIVYTAQEAIDIMLAMDGPQ